LKEVNILAGEDEVKIDQVFSHQIGNSQMRNSRESIGGATMSGG
jgi:hypothetical protein